MTSQNPDTESTADYPREDRESHQQDAYAVARWLRRVDEDGSLHSFFEPSLNTEERRVAELEGWILGEISFASNFEDNGSYN